MKAKTITFNAMTPGIRYSNYFELGDVTCWGPRIIPDYELIFIVSGEFRYKGAENRLACPGDVLCIPPGELHVFHLERRLNGSAAISCIHLEFEAGLRRSAGEYHLETEPPRLTQTANDLRIHLLFKGVAEARAGTGLRKDDIANCMVRELLLRLAEIWRGGTNLERSERAKRMGQLITENLTKPLNRKKLAKLFALSPARVDCVFKEEFGMTPTQFLHSARVAKACASLLDEGRSVKETAAMLGFSDEAHFSKIFKRHMGMPPSRLLTKAR